MVHSSNHHLFICYAPDKRKERDKEKKGGGEGTVREDWELPLSSSFHHQLRKQAVCHIVALPFTLKSILRQKEELRKLKYFTMQKHNLQKILPKEKPKSFKIL
jgi:hypothetical protein